MTVKKKDLSRSVRTITFLLLIVGICSTTLADGLPGEFFVTQRWRDLLSSYSPATNPAFLTEENYFTVRGCEGFIMQNTFRLTEIGITIPVGLYESWGISYFGENDPPIEQYGIDPVTETAVALNTTISNTNNIFMLSYANNLWGHLSLGANLNVSYQTNFSSSVDSGIVSLGGDLGLSYRLLLNPLIGEHLAGLTFENILAPASFAQQSYANNVKASWVAYFWDRQIDAGLDVDFKNLYRALAIDENPRSLEYDFSARVGGWILRILKAYVQFGPDYVGFSGGVNYPQINQGRDFMFLYQYMLMGEDATSHSMYVRAELGNGRAVSAKKLSTTLNPLPNDLYNRACRLYFAGKYWDAYFVFSQILVQYPTFFKNDWVMYYRPSCLEMLDMRDLAVVEFKDMKQQYPASVVQAYADLGLMRLYYRDGMLDDVQKQFSQLTRTGVPDSLRFAGNYLMGQAYMQQKSYWQASELFAAIPATHPEYLFAQHSMAICNILANNNTAKALEIFQNCVQAKATTPAEKEIQDRSYLFMGYIYYEQKTLSKAILALTEVPKSSYYYEDALLGQCWTALMARQWSDCIKFGAALQGQTRKPTIQCEGALVEAYGWWMLKNTYQADVVLQAIAPTAQKLKAIDRDTLETEHGRYQRNRSAYDELAREADKLAMKLQSNTSARMADSLHAKQVPQQQELAKFMVFRDEFKRSSFFARSSETIKNDIEYVSAMVQKASKASLDGSQKLQEQQQQKQKDIESQIEKLKKQMDQLNQEKK